MSSAKNYPRNVYPIEISDEEEQVASKATDESGEWQWYFL